MPDALVHGPDGSSITEPTLVNVTAGILSIVATASRLTDPGPPTTAYGRSIPAGASVFRLSGEVGDEDLGPLALRGPASQ